MDPPQGSGTDTAQRRPPQAQWTQSWWAIYRQPWTRALTALGLESSDSCFQKLGALSGSPCNKDYSTLGSIFGNFLIEQPTIHGAGSRGVVWGRETVRRSMSANVDTYIHMYIHACIHRYRSVHIYTHIIQ